MKGLGIILTVAILMCLASISIRRDSNQSSDPATKTNLIFITVDTLRADHTPFGNYFRHTMPATAQFFKDGLNFTHAETVRTSTVPSYGSMLSGFYPFHTGVRNNYAQLNPEIDTLAEKLKRHGFITAGFVSSFIMVGRMSGLQQGFDLYDDFVLERELNRESYERTAGNTIKHALSWLEKVPRNRRFFLFLHLIDPHGPYHPPPPSRDHFRSNQSRTLTADQIPDTQFIPPVMNLYQYIDWYDGEIFFVDSQLEALYKKLRTFEHNSWFLFVADHGEFLGERETFFTHGKSCYRFESKIPMVWLPPIPLRARYRPAKIPAPVSTVDVTPTSLEALQIPINTKLDGESLIPIFRGGNLRNPFRFIERIWGKDLSVAAFDSRFKMIKNYKSVPNPNWPSKLWRHNIWVEHSVEFYDLSQDPKEGNNRHGFVKKPEELSAALNKFASNVRYYKTPFVVKKFHMPEEQIGDFVKQRTRGEVIVLTDEEQEKLKALGYTHE
jgi:arylsulfatase A-like enzyme